MQKEGKYTSLHRTCSKLPSQLTVQWFMGWCVWSCFANFNLLCLSLCRKKVTSVFIFLSLHDYSPLKVIKCCKLHKSGEKGREQEMRGKAHLHLHLKWQMQMDQMIWQEGNVYSSLQLFADRKKKSIGQALLHFHKMPVYQTFNKPPWFHLEIPDDILKPFRAAISLFCLRFHLSSAAKERLSVAC